jgi:uncharacterized protein (DUF2147 family)
MRILKISVILALLLLVTAPLFAQSLDDVFGLWKSIDDETGKAKSVILVYKYQGKLYGRILITLDEDEKVKETYASPVERAQEMPEKPYYAGLDIIWDLEPKKDKWVKGKICDPAKGKLYGCEISYDTKKGELQVRGKIGPLGRNQFWQKARPSDIPSGFVVPTNLVPKIPKV